MSKNPIWLTATPDPYLAVPGFYQSREGKGDF